MPDLTIHHEGISIPRSTWSSWRMGMWRLIESAASPKALLRLLARNEATISLSRTERPEEFAVIRREVKKRVAAL